MGISETALQVDGGLETEGKRWVIAGIPVRAPLKPIYTNPAQKEWEGTDGQEECSTTPTGEEARIPTRLTCPPAPRKRKPSFKCNYVGPREFFTPPELETVFMQRAS